MQTKEGIGETLAATRRLRGIGLDEVEDRLKLRRRYLLAMEQEQWQQLPGPTYARAFLRTYATYLGLDAEALVADYSDQCEPAEAEGLSPPTAPDAQTLAPLAWPRFASAGPSRRAVVVVVAAIVAAVLILIAVSGGDDGPSAPAQRSRHSPADASRASGSAAADQLPSRAEVRFATTGEVWVCVVDQNGRALVDGVTFPAGEQEGAFRAKRLEMTFGNGQLELRANGKPVPIGSSADPIGYRVTPAGIHPLAPLDRPTCG